MNINFKNMAIGTILGGIVLFLMGFLCYGVLCADFMENNGGTATGVMKNPPVLWMIFLGNLAMAKLITYIFDRWAGIKTFLTGAKAGAIIGLMVAVSYGFISMGTTNIMTWNAVLCDWVCTTAMTALAGGVIGWALGKWGESKS